MGINEWEKPEKRIPLKQPLCIVCNEEISIETGNVRDDGFGAYAIHDECERYFI